MVHSDRSKHVYLNPMSDSRIRPRRGFTSGGYTIYLTIIILFIFHLRALLLPPFKVNCKQTGLGREKLICSTLYTDRRRRTSFCVPKYRRSRSYCPRVGGPLFRPTASALIHVISLNSDVMSSHIVWRHFSPETHKNFHSGSGSRANSPWISRQHWW